MISRLWVRTPSRLTTTFLRPKGFVPRCLTAVRCKWLADGVIHKVSFLSEASVLFATEIYQHLIIVLYSNVEIKCLLNFIQSTSNAAFLLACRLPHCSANAACSFIVNPERCCRNGSSQSGIASVLNWSQLYEICRCGQSGKVIDLLARRCLPLGHPWAASGVYAVVQLLPSRQSGNLKAASGKLVWKQHKTFSENKFLP